MEEATEGGLAGSPMAGTPLSLAATAAAQPTGGVRLNGNPGRRVSGRDINWAPLWLSMPASARYCCHQFSFFPIYFLLITT
jgi:hypothetical protein